TDALALPGVGDGDAVPGRDDRGRDEIAVLILEAGEIPPRGPVVARYGKVQGRAGAAVGPGRVVYDEDPPVIDADGVEGAVVVGKARGRNGAPGFAAVGGIGTADEAAARPHECVDLVRGGGPQGGLDDPRSRNH